MATFNYLKNEETLKIKFEKNIDSNVANLLATEIKKEIDKIFGVNVNSNTAKIVFDLKETDYASSFFLRLVMMSASRVKVGNLIVENANQFIRDLFKTSGLERFLNILDQEEVVEKFTPSENFSKRAWIKSFDEYKKMHEESLNNPEDFWLKMAKEHIIWNKVPTKALEWNLPYAKWFADGSLNVSYNCLDKHLVSTPDKTAILWEGEPESPNSPAEVRNITYKQLHEKTCKIANVLKKYGIVKGDRVLVYMPMIPEAAATMLACARIGAIHSVVFAGFSPQAIADRANDCKAKLIITADGTYRRGSILNLKKIVDEAMTIKNEAGELLTSSVEKILTYKHASNVVNMNSKLDVWLNEEMATAKSECAPEEMNSEDKLFILYTSGSTGKPKGIIHSTAGYLLGAKLTHKYIFDIKDNDIFWCTADVGWITGHSYIVYGPLANCSTVFMYEGTPNYPDAGRFWKMIQKHKLTILYTAPTAIRSFMKWGDHWPKQYDLSSLRLMGSVGEPINPQAWLWYNENIGHNRCPIVDTWWQTETGSILISPIPGAIATKPGSATVPFFGIDVDIVDKNSISQPANKNASMIIKRPWPSMARGIWGDPERFLKTYWEEHKGVYTTGDTARKDKDGYFWIVGREDDVLNVSGHRIGTAEIESSLVSHPSVAEAAAVGRADDLKGSALIVFVTLKQGIKHTPELGEELRQHVGKQLGPVMKPEEVRFTEALPKTRSGKIMRRLLKQIAAGTAITGDITTLEDFNVLSKLTEDQE